jgi:hypothetical protein
MQKQNRYDLRLGVGIGPIELGMNREEVISILGKPNVSEEGYRSGYLKDIYDLMGLRIDYQIGTNICKAIEVTNEVELMYLGDDILSLSWEDFYRWMKENDPDIEEEVGSYTSYKGRIASGPNVGGDVGSKEIETVLIFSEDYWESKKEQEAASQKRLEEMPSLEEMAKELGLEWILEPELK